MVMSLPAYIEGRRSGDVTYVYMMHISDCIYRYMHHIYICDCLRILRGDEVEMSHMYI